MLMSRVETDGMEERQGEEIDRRWRRLTGIVVHIVIGVVVYIDILYG